MSKTVTVAEELIQAIIEYGNSTFDAGEYDDDSEEVIPYEQVNAICQARLLGLRKTVTALVADHDVALAALEETLKQLPETMQHCTILFKECAKGHGWLTATNWIQHECNVCERDALRAALDAQAKEIEGLRKVVLSAGDQRDCPFCGRAEPLDMPHFPDCIITRIQEAHREG